MNASGFQRFMVKYLEKSNYDAVFPMTDVTIPLTIDALEKTEIAELISHIDTNNYNLASDKNIIIQIAKRLSIPYPKTIEVDKVEDLVDIGKLIEYPVVIKPSRSTIIFKNKILTLKVKYANNYPELKRKSRILLAYDVKLLVQEIIKGCGIGFFCLYQKGNLKRTFCHKRILEKPPSGGVSVLCESIKEDPLAKDSATRLLNAIGWSGTAMVEFKKEYNTGIPYLMEINARFWGSIELAVKSGVDFPIETVNMINMKNLDIDIGNYKEGVRCSWFVGIFDHLYLLIKSYKFKELKDSLRVLCKLWLDCHDFVLDRKDIKPFIYEVFQNVRNVI
jgi:predicted ATP-grasp superfamily ATP-dependent carboligase